MSKLNVLVIGDLPIPFEMGLQPMHKTFPKPIINCGLVLNNGTLPMKNKN
jgi:hypothetical protein